MAARGNAVSPSFESKIKVKVKVKVKFMKGKSVNYVTIELKKYSVNHLIISSLLVFV